MKNTVVKVTGTKRDERLNHLSYEIGVLKGLAEKSNDDNNIENYEIIRSTLEHFNLLDEKIIEEGYSAEMENN